MRESENKNKRRLFLKFQLNPILHCQVTHDYVCYIAPKDNCLVDETFSVHIALISYWNDFSLIHLGKWAS